MFGIFSSGLLQPGENGNDGEWTQDCLTTLLKLLCALGLEGGTDSSNSSDAENMLSVPLLKPVWKKGIFVE